MSYHLPLLGIDIGNVIMAGDNDALFGSKRGLWTEDDEQRMLAIPGVTGAVDTIGRLEKLFGAEQVYLVSKAHKNTEAKTLRWLAHNDFCTRTGLHERHILFCREWPEKQIICHWLGIAYFVDDRADVITSLENTVPHRYLFGPQDVKVFATAQNDGVRLSPSLHLTPNWNIAEQLILRDFSAE